MNIKTVGTGSAGNCYLLQRDNGKIIVLDCGCVWKKVMIACHFRPADIDFALVTHSHSDHSRGMKDFVHNGIAVYSPENLATKRSHMIGDVKVIPFELPHDVPCYGYLLKVDGHTIIYMTDFEYCGYTFATWGVDTWIIACNHIDIPDSDEVKYAHVVMGHSSLDTVKNILKANMSDAMKNIILIHYSADADTIVMVDEIQNTVGDNVAVSLAEKGKTIYL